MCKPVKLQVCLPLTQLIQIRDQKKKQFEAIFEEKFIVLTHFDQMKTPKCYTSFESYGSLSSNG